MFGEKLSEAPQPRRVVALQYGRHRLNDDLVVGGRILLYKSHS
jgi:hypothetical protein